MVGHGSKYGSWWQLRHRYHHGSGLKHNPLRSAWLGRSMVLRHQLASGSCIDLGHPLVVIEVMDMNMDHGCYRAIDSYKVLVSSSDLDVIMAPSDSIDHLAQCNMALKHQHGHKWRPRPWASVWPLVETWITDVNTDPGWGRTQTWPLAAVCSSPPPFIQFGLFLQHINWPASLSLSFIHHIFANHNDTYLP